MTNIFWIRDILLNKTKKMRKLNFANHDFQFLPFEYCPRLMLSTHPSLPTCGLLLISENTGLFMYGTFLIKYFFKNSANPKIRNKYPCL